VVGQDRGRELRQVPVELQVSAVLLQHGGNGGANTVHHSTLQHSTVQYLTVQYSAQCPSLSLSPLCSTTWHFRCAQREGCGANMEGVGAQSFWCRATGTSKQGPAQWGPSSRQPRSRQKGVGPRLLKPLKQLQQQQQQEQEWQQELLPLGGWGVQATGTGSASTAATGPVQRVQYR